MRCRKKVGDALSVRTIEGEGGRVRDLLVLSLACNLPRRFTLKKVPVTSRVSDFASLDDFFEAVGSSPWW
jgi:hypothetical protein